MTIVPLKTGRQLAVVAHAQRFGLPSIEAAPRFVVIVALHHAAHRIGFGRAVEDLSVPKTKSGNIDDAIRRGSAVR